MAVTDIRVAPLAPANTVTRFIARVVAGISAWNETRVTRSALSQLSDRELEDIGLCRGDIHTITKHI